MAIYEKDIYENELFVEMYKGFVNAIETFRNTLGFTNDEMIDSFTHNNVKETYKYDLHRNELLSKVRLSRVLLSSSIIEQLEQLAISIFEIVPAMEEGELKNTVSAYVKKFYDELDVILIDYLPY